MDSNGKKIKQKKEAPIERQITDPERAAEIKKQMEDWGKKIENGN